MPRRGGRDRWRPRSRELVRLAATDRARRALEVEPPRAHRAYDRPMLLCTHGVHWTSCTTCSKPVRRA